MHVERRNGVMGLENQLGGVKEQRVRGSPRTPRRGGDHLTIWVGLSRRERCNLEQTRRVSEEFRVV